MQLNWIDVNNLSFNTLLLLERVQLSWMPGWLKEDELAIALQANPAVEWYLRHKCPEIDGWVDAVMAKAGTALSPAEAGAGEGGAHPPGGAGDPEADQ